MQRLCVTVTAPAATPTMAELVRRRDAVSERAAAGDLVEVRLDSVRDPDPGAALAGRRRSVIVTCRPTWEGGAFAGSEEERKRILVQALDMGAEYVDVEWGARFEDLVQPSHGHRVVMSSHDFDTVPDDLAARVHA